MLRPVGAVGVLLNAFSFLQLLKPFDYTGPLIKIIQEILKDILPFTAVLVILLLGFSNAFAVCMPTNADYGFSMQGTGGPVSGLVTTYLAMMGTFDVDHYTQPEAVAMLLGFLFLIVVVMMNLLIAIMADSFEKVSRISTSDRSGGTPCRVPARSLWRPPASTRDLR